MPMQWNAEADAKVRVVSRALPAARTADPTGASSQQLMVMIMRTCDVRLTHAQCATVAEGMGDCTPRAVRNRVGQLRKVAGVVPPRCNEARGPPTPASTPTKYQIEKERMRAEAGAAHARGPGDDDEEARTPVKQEYGVHGRKRCVVDLEDDDDDDMFFRVKKETGKGKQAVSNKKVKVEVEEDDVVVVED